MYILVTFNRYSQKVNRTTAFENFEELKKEVIEKLNGRGWYDKKSVDLRSLKSCIDYLFVDCWHVRVQKSTSYKKYINYLYGARKGTY